MHEVAFCDDQLMKAGVFGGTLEAFAVIVTLCASAVEGSRNKSNPNTANMAKSAVPAMSERVRFMSIQLYKADTIKREVCGDRAEMRRLRS